MSETMTGLPTWDEMSDVDKGAALLHMWKREWEGAGYAVREYPARYFDDPRLTALSRVEACRHAVSVCGSDEEIREKLGDEEHARLYDLALEEPDRRCLWAARNPAGEVAAPTWNPTEAAARDLLATWKRDAGYWAERGHTGETALLKRDEAGGEWVEVPR